VSLVSATAPCQPAHICEDLALDHVEVTFTVDTKSYDRLRVPQEIEASDGRNCTVVGDYEDRKWHLYFIRLFAAFVCGFTHRCGRTTKKMMVYVS
jgi:hypothetical protein